jgi:hypothetical protein
MQSMRYRLRTLVMLTAVVPPVLSLAWFVASSLIWLLLSKGDLDALPLAASVVLVSAFVGIGFWMLSAPPHTLLESNDEDGPAFFEQQLKRSGGNHDRAMASVGRHYRVAGFVCLMIAVALLLAISTVILDKMSAK